MHGKQKVIALVPRTAAAPDAALVALAKDILRMAKAGEITGLAVATTGPGAASSGWEGVDGNAARAAALGGAIATLAHRYNTMLASD